MAPPNIRELTSDIREALDRFPREALIEILTYVFKEYVVEGPAPIQGAPANMRDELEGQSFGEVIRALQLRLDLPELALFEVVGDRVTVKIGGRAMPVETQSARPEPLASAPPPPPVAPAAPSGLTSVSVAVPAAAARQGAPASPGTSREEVPLVGRPQQAAAPAAPAQPGTPAQPGAAPATKPAPAAATTDDAVDKTGRFGLLEVD
jgi:hypothetical protein